MKQPTALVCAPADTEYAIPGSAFDRHCSRCKGRVMVAPSGQLYLRSHPHTRISCVHCCEPDDMFGGVAAGWAAALREAKTAVINPWKKRN